MMLRKTKEKQEPIYTPVDPQWSKESSLVVAPLLSQEIRSMLDPNLLDTFEALCDYLHIEPETNPHKTVMSCAANSGEGSTTVAAGLAIAATKRKGIKTLLVDANHFNKRVSCLFDGDSPAERMACGAFVKHTPIDGLSVSSLPVAQSPELGTVPLDHLQEFILEAHGVSSLVVIDAPPVHLSKEAISCATYADVIAWVHNEYLTTTQGLVKALSQLPSGMSDKVRVISNHKKQE